MDASSPPSEIAASGPAPAVVRLDAGDAGDFLGPLRAALAAHPGADFAWIAKGIAEPFAWLTRLQKAAYSMPRIAAAVPMCDLSPVTELVDEATRAAHKLDPLLLDQTAYCVGDRACYEIPRLHPVCAYLRRDALDAVVPMLPAGPASPQSVLDTLVRLWRATGWSPVACDFLYVERPGHLSAAPGPATLEEQAFLRHSPFAGLRRAVSDSIRIGLPPVSTPGLDERPVQLHVMHFWGGGLERWVRDFGRADPMRINMILASFRIGEDGGQRLILYSDPSAMAPVRVWDIARPIRSSAGTSLEYRAILEEIVRDFGVEAVLVSSLINHSLDALTLPVKTVVVCHDFYPVCQAINPRFGKTCVRCTLEDLRACAKSNPLNTFFAQQQTPEEWHAMRGLFVDHVIANGIEMIVPSQSVANTLRQLDPRLAKVPMHTIGHGIDLDAPKITTAPREDAQRLRIVVLGRLSLHKGLELMREAAEGLRPHAKITLLGCGRNGVELAEKLGWKAIEKYELADLPRVLQSLNPDACLLPSVVPETFSYTLSELMALGVPPIASAVGALKERIVDGETGFLFEPDKDSLIEAVRALKSQPERLEKVARNLAALPKGRGTADMVKDYHAIIPLKPHPVARFRVGLGRSTSLTEPYRQLNESYAQLTSAYQQLSGAYAHTTQAYEQTRGAYDKAHGEVVRLHAVLGQWGREVSALKVPTHPWRIPQALGLMQDLAKQLKKPEE
ncbi:glycosyltransferase [Usitatibacter palustris]|uniref:Glycosyl transferase family 1 domain-containing protein n=1 Tax=Usitatibacter palustris TaxID=2732487 RepID=A0A6M4HC38_9PROT|nr:glycosyltransferase [Usitatibacter palustris]QJR15557.1 hypothetical protein DSM104440_02379 [Usitatibacter palustris]